jgi:hypothetical protein
MPRLGWRSCEATFTDLLVLSRQRHNVGMAAFTMVSEIADAPLAEVVHRLVAALQPERIYLFGSRALVARPRRRATTTCWWS